MKKLLTSVLTILLMAVLVAAAVPSVSMPTLTPATADVTTPLVCSTQYSDADSDLGTVYFQWFKNGAIQPSYNSNVPGVATGATVTAQLPVSAMHKTDRWNCGVTASDGVSNSTPDYSASVVILNSKPVASNVRVTPTVAYTETTLTCSATYTDADRDAESGSTYKWFKNSVEMAGQTASTLLGTSFVKGDVISCEYAPKDGSEFGAAVSSATNTVQDSVPTTPALSDISPSVAYKADTLTAAASGSSDLDSDAITYFYKWTVGSTVLKDWSSATDANQLNCNSYTQCAAGATVIVSAKAVAADASSTTVTKSRVISSANRLEIDRVDVKVDSSTDSDLSNGDTVSEDVLPLSKIEVKVRVMNTYTDAEDLKIKDIFVNAILRDICSDCDDSDIEQESAEFDLSADKTKTVTLTFNVPMSVDEGTYDLEIHAEGRDQNRSMHQDDWTIRLEVNKKSNDVRINTATVSPETLSCDRNGEVEVQMINFGADEEDNVQLRIDSTALGISYVSDRMTLTNDLSSDDSRFTKTLSFTVPSSLKAGNYPINVNVKYGTNFDYSDYQGINLVVKDCAVEQPTTPVKNDTVVVQPPVVIPPTGSVVAQPTGTGSSFFNSTTFMVLVIIADVFLVLVALLLLARFLTRS